MEKAGCFELAYATVSAICRFTSDADYVSASLATVHLGRIARQMNDLSTAEDCYTTMLASSLRERDGPLAARGHIGLALLHDMRGNLPAAEAEYLKALELAVPSGSTCGSACQGLMTIALVSGRLADALLYGWRLYDATVDDFDVRTCALADLSAVALRAGFFEAALRGFEHALTLSQVPRIRLVALTGAVRAAARVGDADRVYRYDRETLQDIARANLPFEAAQAFLWLAEAWAVIGDPKTARERLAQVRALAERFGYNEYRFRADALAASLDQAPVAHVTAASDAETVPLVGSRQDPAIDVGIRRLEALAV
jgi:tetratricopeptide (TPR) repeat protein